MIAGATAFLSLLAQLFLTDVRRLAPCEAVTADHAQEIYHLPKDCPRDKVLVAKRPPRAVAHRAGGICAAGGVPWADGSGIFVAAGARGSGVCQPRTGRVAVLTGEIDPPRPGPSSYACPQASLRLRRRFRKCPPVRE